MAPSQLHKVLQKFQMFAHANLTIPLNYPLNWVDPPLFRLNCICYDTHSFTKCVFDKHYILSIMQGIWEIGENEIYHN